MIDRDELLHVALLARLQVPEGEVEETAAQLSTILDHIARIEELDLDGVEPTAHVVEIDDALRPDEPTEPLPRETVLKPAPAVQDDGFLVPSPQAQA
jgi:aspartyl-tRNA(Asn)/glutamyl-tRNA(Gln) amidotransferase subunit C